MSEANIKKSAQAGGSLDHAIRTATHDFVYIVDGTGKLLDLNDRMMQELGMERAESVGADAAAIWAEEDRPIIKRMWDAVVTAKRSERSIRRLRGANGGLRIMETREAPLVDAGEVSGVIGIARDVTEEYAIEEKLWEERQNREAVLEYSVRASLGLIKGYVYSLQKLNSLTTEQRERYGSVIIEEIETLSRNIDNLMLTRGLTAEVGREELCDLSKIVQEARSLVVPEAQRREIAIECRNVGAEVLLYTRKEALLRVLVNLAEFCILRITHSGRLEIDVSANDEYVDIALRLHGEHSTPISGDDLFEGNGSSDGESGEGAAGSKMNLYVARLLCEAIGGGLSARISEAGQQEFAVMIPRQSGFSVMDTVALGGANGQ